MGKDEPRWTLVTFRCCFQRHKRFAREFYHLLTTSQIQYFTILSHAKARCREDKAESHRGFAPSREIRDLLKLQIVAMAEWRVAVAKQQQWRRARAMALPGLLGGDIYAQRSQVEVLTGQRKLNP